MVCWRAIDGAGVVCYFIFVVAAMDGVMHAIMTGRSSSWASLAPPLWLFACSRSLLGGVALDGAVTGVMFATPRPAEHGPSHRVARAGVPEMIFLFFALAQSRFYLMPQLLCSIAPW